MRLLPVSAKQQYEGTVLRCITFRHKYDDLLSNPTTEAQTPGHTRVTAAYKAKVGLGAELGLRR